MLHIFLNSLVINYFTLNLTEQVYFHEHDLQYKSETITFINRDKNLKQNSSIKSFYFKQKFRICDN